MNEAETRAELIDPALAAAGWGVLEGSRIRREYLISPGRIEGRGKALKADYVLEFRNTKLATVEAKAVSEALTEGVGQAKDYAGKLAVRFTYSTNGTGIYSIDMETGAEGEIAAFPSPEELWAKTFAQASPARSVPPTPAFTSTPPSRPNSRHSSTSFCSTMSPSGWRSLIRKNSCRCCV